jgi:hypothetical protein
MDIQTIRLADPLWVHILTQLRHDVFHLPEYMSVEAQRIQAVPEAFWAVEGDKQFFVPYLIRSCQKLFGTTLVSDPISDVVSPYGYPGILLNEAAKQDRDFLKLALEQLITTLRSQQICSAFFRLHPILSEDFTQIYPPEICQETGVIVGIDLTQSEQEIWRQTRSDHRKDINRHKRSGLIVRMVDVEQHLPEFLEVYRETMNRVNAAQMYYFDSDFFCGLLALNEKLHLCVVEIENQVASACLIMECCGVVSSFLSGTKNQFLKLAPEKLLFDYVRFWAKERGNQVFNMGGGVGSSKDGVYYFKAGFSDQRHPFLTLRLVIDPEQYTRLVCLRADQLQVESEHLLNVGFFPAYRCSNGALQNMQKEAIVQADKELQTV